VKMRQHLPDSIDTDPTEITFESLAELLQIEWVASWSNEIFDGIPFWRYSQSQHGDEWMLIAEWKEGDKHRWWVLGYLSDNVGLPEFKASK